MKFRTILPPLPFRGLISHSTPVMLVGSCFADNIGKRMADEAFEICINPLGTLYNPASIHALFDRLRYKRTFTADDLAFRDGAWHCWHAHSSLSRAGKPENTLSTVNNALEKAGKFLNSARIVIITLGTTHIFYLADTNTLVANCHKFAPTTFNESELSLTETVTLLTQTVANIRACAPGTKIILTVSPVKYTTWGLHNDMLSKATLLLACNELERSLPDVIYFPAYEALAADLRDYRFYAPDLKHPSESAADYIYELFGNSFYSQSTQTAAAQALKLAKQQAHRQIIPTEPETTQPT